MRVFLDHRVAVGGVDRYARALIRGLKQLPEGPEIIDHSSAGFLKRPFTPWGRWLVGRDAETSRADVVHGMHFEAPTTDLPVVVTIQDLIPLEFPDSMPSRAARTIFKRMILQTLRRAERVIAPSDLTQDALVSFGFDRGSIRVIPLAPDPIFRPSGQTEDEGARARFSGGKPYVAVIGHRKAHKNLQVVQSVAAAVAPDVAIVCIGPSPLVEPVITLGSLSDTELRGFLSGAEAYLLPSIIEGFGLPAVESASCGTPVIGGARIGALPYLGRWAHVTDITDPHAIAHSIETLIPRSRNDQVPSLGLTERGMATSTNEVYIEAKDR